LKTASGTTTLAGKSYHWLTAEGVAPYAGLGDSARHILRIADDSAGFDIVMTYWRHAYREAQPWVIFGPIVVLGSAFPSAATAVQKGLRIRLRPRISVVREGIIDDMAVRRIIAWCLSPHFRAVKCDLMGLPQMSPQDDYSLGAPAFKEYDMSENK